MQTQPSPPDPLELQIATQNVWQCHDELARLESEARGKRARRLYRNATSALKRVLRPFGAATEVEDVGGAA